MSIFLILYLVVILGYRTMTHVLLVRFVRNSKKPLRDYTSYPGISVLIPIKGPLESHEGVRAILDQHYPGPMELIIAIRDPHDPAVASCREFVAKTPTALTVKWAIGGEPSGLNPKNANLAQAYQHAEYEWIYCSDVDTRPEPTHLRRMLETADHHPNRFVTSIIVNESPTNLGSCLESFGTNLEATGFFLFSSLNPKWGVIGGASNFFHRSLLEKVGGFAAVVNYISDDLRFGKLFEKVGGESYLCGRTCRTTQTAQTFGDFKERYVRWLMVTRFYRPEIFWPAPFNWASQWITLFGILFQSSTYFALGIVLMLMRWAETLFVEIMLEAPKKDWLKSWTIIVYDWVIPYIWISAVFRNEVIWNSNILNVRAGGRLERRATE